MSGIIGIYFFDNKPVEKNHLEEMLEAISYRGPDASEVWHEGKIGLGNCLLRTTPEATNEKLPLLNRRKDIVLVADARIDNRNEILADLRITNHKISDSELILLAYERWQDKCVKKLIGDFAFIIWDKKQNHLFCTRDALGVRPFYYYKDNNFIAFASDPASFFTLPTIKKQLNLEALLDFLLFDFPSEATEFEKVFHLLPGHTLTIQGDSLKFYNYWDINHNHELRLKDSQEYEEAFLNIFSKSVTDRLRSNGNVGVSLSGGFDSSSILCLIEDLKTQRKTNVDICAYSAVFPEKPFDEKDFIISIQEKWGTKIHWVKPKMPKAPWESQNTLWTNSQPFWDNTYILDEIIYKAKENKTKILLSGHGGDEFLSPPFCIISDFLLSGQLIRAWNCIKNFTRFESLTYWYTIKNFLPAMFSRITPNSIKKLRTSLYVQRNFSWLTKHYQGLAIKHIRSKASNFSNQRFRSNASRALYISLKSGSFTRPIHDWERTILHIAPIELRLPFFDRRIVEFVFSIPQKELIHNNRPKDLLRTSLRYCLPQKINNRNEKQPIATTYIHQQLTENNQTNIIDLLNSSHLEKLGLIDGKIAQAEYNAFCSKYTNNLTKSRFTLSKLYLLLFLESWLRAMESK